MLLVFATIVGIALTVGLGCWQLSRAAQKNTLQAALNAQEAKQTLDGTSLLLHPQPLELLHQTATLKGVWLADKTVFLDNRQMDAKVGFFVVTPLRLEGSPQVILVQRGWIARNFEHRDALGQVDTPSGSVVITGRIALPPSKLFDFGKTSASVIRQNLDLGQFAAEIAQPLLPVTLLQTDAASEGLLRTWPSANLGVDKHYGYAAQWFAMAALIALLFVWFRLLQPYLHRRKDSSSHV